MSYEIVRFAVKAYARFPLAFRNVEDLSHECGMQISRKPFCSGEKRFGPLIIRIAFGCLRTATGSFEMSQSRPIWNQI